jgi:pescadillo protein
MLYCTITKCFKKAFFSIKGIYYQVEIMGQNITWVAPYQFNQKLPFDIDFKVMTTFLEFYLSLLKFVNHKLFSDLGMTSSVILAHAYDEDNNLKVAFIKTLQKQALKKFK